MGQSPLWDWGRWRLSQWLMGKVENLNLAACFAALGQIIPPTTLPFSSAKWGSSPCPLGYCEGTGVLLSTPQHQVHSRVH